MEVEKKLKDIPNLNYAVIRPAVTYGTGDCSGLSKWNYSNFFPYDLC